MRLDTESIQFLALALGRKLPAVIARHMLHFVQAPGQTGAVKRRISQS